MLGPGCHGARARAVHAACGALVSRNDLLELLDDRVGTRSTLITSQLPVKAWHTYLNDPTLADAILNRVVHSSHKIDLKATKSLRDTGAPQAA